MSLLLRFAFPWFLTLLVLLPVVVYLGLHVRALGKVRRWIATGLRVVIIGALVLALAGAELVRRNDELAVFFLLDRSDSVPDAERRVAAQYVRNAVDAFMQPGDQAGVVAFARDASIERKMSELGDLGDVQSLVEPAATDIASAIRLAMAAFPQGYMRRIVLLSDGNETRGAALEEIKAARAAGVSVDVVPLAPVSGAEVRVREVDAPSVADADAPFQLRVVVESTEATTATLRLFQNAMGDQRMLSPQEVTLEPGDNVFLLSQELSASGLYEYEVRVEAENDAVAANNTGRAFTRVRGEPVVLNIAAQTEESEAMVAALRDEGLNVTTIRPLQMPPSLAQYQPYDSIVLNDISATDLSSDQMAMLESLVRDQGIGLVMVGGPNTFGAGGFLETAIERALPVNMDIKQRRILPRGALAVILHTVEIPDGNVWAREISLAALNVLASQDLMGLLGYTWERGDAWLHNLSPVADKRAHTQAIINQIQAIGDMPAVNGTLNMAGRALERADAAVKRIVIISDGDPAAPQQSTVNSIIAAGINVSTVCIAPHSPSDQVMLRRLAEATGGRFYFVNNAQNLPQIFSKEAATVRRGLLIEEPFTPLVQHDSELLFGLAQTGLPQLRGYVVTTAKANATVPLISHEDDPVLAHWRYGLGKAVAFTSDATSRWAAQWLDWEGFNRFWAQAVRWSMRETTDSTFQVDTRLVDGRGRIRIDAVDAEGRFVNFLAPAGVVTGPAPDFSRIPLELEQTGPGVYEGDFPVDDTGVYLANIAYTTEDGAQGTLTTGLALDYSREYEYTDTNLNLLQQAASTGGGRVLIGGDNPFRHDLVPTPRITPIWPWLLAIAALALPIEIFVRRVVVPIAPVLAWLAAQLRKLPGLGRLLPAPRARRIQPTGVYRASGRAAPTHDFGRAQENLLEPREGGPVAPGSAPAPATEEATEETESAYTAQLLAAKQRAIQGKKRKLRSQDDEDRP